MIRLLLLRHAKSAWDDADLKDFDRPLNARGRDDAQLMAAFMGFEGLLPARILCSSAQRARETLAHLLLHFPEDTDICVSRRLYEADAPGYLDAIRDYGATASSLMVIGHNPALEDVATILAPVGDAPSLQAMHGKFPTSGLAVIDFEAPRFSEIDPGGGRLAAFHTSRGVEGD